MTICHAVACAFDRLQIWLQSVNSHGQDLDECSTQCMILLANPKNADLQMLPQSNNDAYCSAAYDLVHAFRTS